MPTVRLIEPVRRALGWNVEDIEEVVRGFKVKSRDKPVDYGLPALRAPKVLVEVSPQSGTTTGSGSDTTCFYLGDEQLAWMRLLRRHQ